MQRLTYKIFILLFMLFGFEQTYAGNLKFETTAEGIIDALTIPKAEHKIKTRSIKEDSDRKTRGIKIVEEWQGQIVEKTIIVSEKTPVHGINLKIEFDVNSYRIRPESFKLLNELGKALTSEKLKEKDLIVKGHTDSDGEEAYNLKLSLNRALAVKLYLTSNFLISSSQLKIAGYGETTPLVPNNTKKNKQINRRVEIATMQ